MAFKSKFLQPEQPESNPETDLESCLICFKDILPSIPSTVEKHSPTERVKLIKNMLHHISLDMTMWSAVSEQCEKMDYPLCCCCETILKQMLYHETRVLKFACVLRNKIRNCRSRNQSYVPKQENGNYTKLREMVTDGKLLEMIQPATSDPIRLFQQWRLMVENESIRTPVCRCKIPPEDQDGIRCIMNLGSGAASQATTPQAISKMLASAAGEAENPIEFPKPPPLSPLLSDPVASTSTTFVGQAKSLTQIENESDPFAPHNDQIGVSLPFLDIRCEYCTMIFFSRVAYENHLFQCKASSQSSNTEQAIIPFTTNGLAKPTFRQIIQKGMQNVGKRTETKSSSSFENKSSLSKGQRLWFFMCSTCEKIFTINEARRYYQLKDDQNHAEGFKTGNNSTAKKQLSHK